MTLSTLHTSQGELSAFIPYLNPDVTEGVQASHSVASRPESEPKRDPAGVHHGGRP